MFDYIWKNEDGEIVSYSDYDFRNTVFRELMNRYNNEFWDGEVHLVLFHQS